jgi:hypothetical protein
MSNCSKNDSGKHGFMNIPATDNEQIYNYITCVACGERRAIKRDGVLIFWDTQNQEWVTDLVSTSSDDSPDVANPPTPPPSPAIERAQLTSKLEVWKSILGDELIVSSDDYITVPADWIKNRLGELQAALDKLDKGQK